MKNLKIAFALLAAAALAFVACSNDKTAGTVTDTGNTIAVTGIYDNALVDVSGIITANNTISPVDYNDIEPIVYVIDEDENFVSPNSNIVNATLRLKRTLKAGIWNTFTIPMDLPIASNIAGKYRSYTDVNGDVLIFSEASSIEAGKPYLVKPDVDIANPVFTGTLSATPAQNVEQTGSNIAFKGIYSPTELKTDKTEQFLTASGKLGYPSSSSTATLKGMRAYFYVPAGTEARVFIEGEDITGIEQIDYQINQGGLKYEKELYQSNYRDSQDGNNKDVDGIHHRSGR